MAQHSVNDIICDREGSNMFEPTHKGTFVNVFLHACVHIGTQVCRVFACSAFDESWRRVCGNTLCGCGFMELKWICTWSHAFPNKLWITCSQHGCICPSDFICMYAKMQKLC